MNPFIVMKFGGTSVKDAPAIKRVIDIVLSRLERRSATGEALRPVVVVSALSKVTDGLCRMADLAAQGQDKESLQLLKQIRTRHLDLTAELILDPVLLEQVNTQVDSIYKYLNKMLQGINLLGELSDRSYAALVSCGEMFSSTIIAGALKQAGISTLWVDARKFMITDDLYKKGTPLTDEIIPRVITEIGEAGRGYPVVITQGFVASTTNGVTTILGRGGSDYSASLIGMALDAQEIEIWTDVDGILTADPRKVKESRRIEVLSFNEAAELAHFGAKVLHPATIQPAIKKNIPVRVLNSMNPQCSGTLILEKPNQAAGAKSVSSKENIVVVNIYSPHMINTSGFLARIFSLFSQYGMSVDLISTSEANVSLTMEQCPPNGLIEELSTFSTVTVREDQSQVSVVGNNLQSIPGFTKQLFWAMEHYNISMISQGASAVNVSLVVDRNCLSEILQSLHKQLFE